MKSFCSLCRDKTIRTAKKVGSGGGGAKPISYDNYSTDTSSQFSVDIVEVSPKGLELQPPLQKHGDAEASVVPEEPGAAEDENEIVLNASRLQVESET